MVGKVMETNSIRPMCSDIIHMVATILAWGIRPLSRLPSSSWETMAVRSSGVGMGTAAELVGADASSAGARTSADISNQGQFQNSPGCRISSTGQRTIINGRVGTISHLRETLSSSTGMQTEREITLGWLKNAMEGRFIPLKVTVAMRLDVDLIELEVEPYTGMWCQTTRQMGEYV